MAEMERIDRYEIESVLGTGAFATVWLARDPVLDLRVAIKVLADNWSRDPGIRARFIEEARVLWQADSPRIVRVHHVGELEDGRPYFVMGWADRGNLRERMQARFQSGSAFAVAEAASISAELCRALRDVHSLGRMHRDVKPANVLIRTAASRQSRQILGLAPDEQLVLADFGLAREIEASAATMVSGSPAYVAPEQARGRERLDERADIYPLGLIMVELLTGASPAERATMLDAAMTPRLDIAGHLARAGVTLPPRMQELAQMMVEPEPANRPASAGDIAQELNTFAQQWPAPTVDGASAGATVVHQPVATQVSTPSQQPSVAEGVISAEPVISSEPRFHSAEPVIAPDETGGLPRWPLIAALVAILGLVGLFVIIQAVDITVSDDPDASATFDTSDIASTTGSTTAVPESVTTLLITDDVVLTSVPLPDFSRLEAGADDVRQVANVASPIEEVTSFYESLSDDEWQLLEVTPVGEDVEIELASPYRTATVMLTKAAVTAGEGITRIEILYSAG